MKRFTVFVLFTALSLVSFTNLGTSEHKFHVSVTQINYLQEKQSLQIISKIFIDDIERLMRERYDKSVTLTNKNEAEIISFYLQRYLNEKLMLTINDEPITLQFIGKEYDNDIMICYLEVEDVKSIETFEIQNTILLELFEDQQNIVRTNINDKKKSFILIKDNPKGMLNFN
jgi:hypothetical protein